MSDSPEKQPTQQELAALFQQVEAGGIIVDTYKKTVYVDLMTAAGFRVVEVAEYRPRQTIIRLVIEREDTDALYKVLHHAQQVCRRKFINRRHNRFQDK